VDLYHRPSIVVSLGEGLAQGSGRSIAGFDLHAAIKACSGPLLGFGGHRAAAGLRMAPAQFEGFARSFDQHCRSILAPETLRKFVEIDAEVKLGMLNRATVEEIERMDPHGIGNPQPLLVADDVELVSAPRIVGDRQNHLQMRFRQGETVLKAIGFNLAERFVGLNGAQQYSILFHPSINEWQGRREVQLEVKDIRPQDRPAKRGPLLDREHIATSTDRS
jgi:single-stranded-DNA-specific exonuclease